MNACPAAPRTYPFDLERWSADDLARAVPRPLHRQMHHLLPDTRASMPHPVAHARRPFLPASAFATPAPFRVRG